MQSPAQKNTKLKFVVVVPPQVEQQAVGRWQTDRQLPYHSIISRPEYLIMYIMHSTMLFHDHFEAVFDDLMIFGHK